MNHAEEKVAGFFTCNNGRVRVMLACLLQGGNAPNKNRMKFHELARIFHELLPRDHKDGRATWQPQGVGSEAYLNGTS